MNGRPSVSVVMPMRDAASTIAAAIASVAAQSLRAWELIVVDDGSIDDSADVVTGLARHDPRIRLVAADGRGIVEALTTACAAARAPLIARMDADDLMRPTRLARQLAHLDAHPQVGLVASRVEFGGDPRTAGGLAAHVDWSNALCTHDQMLLARFIDAPVVHPSVTFRRSVLDTHGGYVDIGGPEDHELWLRWLRAGVRFAKLPEILLTWNDPPDRMTRTDPRYSELRHARLRCRALADHLHDRKERRSVWLWGAGRVTRRRFDTLADHGVKLHGYVDIDRRKIGRAILGRPVVAADELPPRDEAFVIAGVAVRGAGALIRARLVEQGRVEGTDFLLAG